MSRPRVLFAGGGTGGHVFPAVAVAEAIEAMADVEVVFCGTARGVEARAIPARGWRLELLDVVPITGGGSAQAIRGALVAARAMASALLLVWRIRPAAVLSVGGYAAGPVTLAAALQGVPVTVLEPNRVVGLANRLLAPFAKRAYVAWEGAGAPFRERARRVYGVPLRAGFGPTPYLPRSSVARVLVVGGSQGAAAFNERMPAAIARLSHLRGLEVVHQAGRDRDADVREAYARQGVMQATVLPFLDDVARAVADSDVVVARAGASTLGELTAIGRAAILVPYPHAAADHQRLNAEALAQAGGAVCIRQDDASPERLAREVERLLGDDAARVRMADASRSRGRATASADVASDLLDLAGIARRPRPSSPNGTNRSERSLAQEAR